MSELPMPAWRDAEARKEEIRSTLTFLSMHYPKYLDDPTALTTPPRLSQSLQHKNISAGYSKFGHEPGLTAWDHLAVDVMPHESEILETIEDLGLAS